MLAWWRAMCPAWTCQVIRVHPDGHWSVIDKLDGHVSPKDTTGHFQALSAQGLAKGSHQRFGNVRPRRCAEAGTATFADVRIECELRNHQARGANLQRTAVEAARFVTKDAHLGNLIGQGHRLVSRISGVYPKKDDKALLDRTGHVSIHVNGGLGDSLHERSHVVGWTFLVPERGDCLC